ncbi:type IV pilin protein [Halomonas sp. PAMB 3232]|uniref:type IV pilin protein n=1 Tax=Halomonas sp. PAMB 3232 TaxID=3075221 RepID=UPI0028A19DA8|nr:type IV pilin protein [Halomonas sp. PAMB 3232]WNL39479.1 type IV pilin protein [Halomonas sp. PAMB 3232]
MTNRFDPRAGATLRPRGFTLIEVLIVVAIVAILAGIAYPGYQRYTQNALRTDAQAGLLSAAAELERCYARLYSYDNGCAIPDTSPDGHYDILRTPGNTNAQAPDYDGGFLLTATTEENDGCSEPLTLNALGERHPERCW